MHLITDNTGRQWPLEVDYLAVKRVKAHLKFDLFTLLESDGRTLIELRDDPVRLVDIVYCLLKPQLDEAGVSDVQFGPRMKGDVLDVAWEAILAELIDFFPKGRRLILRLAALQAGLSVAADEDAKHKLLQSTPAPTSGRPSSASPVASAWTRARSRCASWWPWIKAATSSPPG